MNSLSSLFDRAFPLADGPIRHDWETLQGVRLPDPLRRWVAAGGIGVRTVDRFAHSWLRNPSDQGDGAADLASDNAFATRVISVQQRTRGLIALYDPFAGLLPLAERDDWFLAAQWVVGHPAMIVGFEQRHEEPMHDGVLASDISSFVGMRHLYDTGVWRDGTLTHETQQILEALSGRVCFGFPFAELQTLSARQPAFSFMADSGHGERLVRRSQWIVSLLRDGMRAANEHWELDRLRRLDPVQASDFDALDQENLATADGLYWLWRSFFLNDSQRLTTLLPKLRHADARWLRDAAVLVEESVDRSLSAARPVALGQIADLNALASEFRRQSNVEL